METREARAVPGRPSNAVAVDAPPIYGQLLDAYAALKRIDDLVEGLGARLVGASVREDRAEKGPLPLQLLANLTRDLAHQVESKLSNHIELLGAIE